MRRVSNSGYVLYRLPSDQLAIFDDETLDRSELNYPNEDIPLEAVPGIMNGRSDGYNDANLHVVSNQFGVYCYVSSNETVLLHLIEYSETKCAATLVSWDDSGFVLGEKKFQARLKFSPSANANAILVPLSDVVRRLSDNLITQELAATLEPQNPPKSAVPIKNAAPLQQSNQAAEDKHKEKIKEESSIHPKGGVTVSASIKKKQVTAMEKTLRNALFFGFPNLAIHPESLATLVERYPDQSAVFSILRKLADNNDVPSKTLHGAAQKTGWREIAQHINTGRDSRGRIYVRSARHKSNLVQHSWDILISWKKDKKSKIERSQDSAILHPSLTVERF